MTDRVLLAVFAHPDDELSAGGTLARYAREGVHTHLLCATRGEVGEAPADLKGFASIAEMRESELKCAGGALGLESVSFLDYRDSGMPGSPDNRHPQALAAAPLEQVAGLIAGFIRRLKPQVVVTFDPIGGYRHPDHIAVHQATVAAFALAGDAGRDVQGLAPFQPQKLYYTVFPNRLLRIGVPLLRLLGQDPSHFGKNKDIDLESLVKVTFPVHARISVRREIDRKSRAAACHASQLEGMGGARARWLQWLFAADETFMRAVPAAPPPRIERDLFEGIA